MSSFDDFVKSVPNARVAPVNSWQPSLSGAMDLVIKTDGSWWHEGTQIKRPELIALFASILRLDDVGYVLVSPVEKWQIIVEDVPFVVELMERKNDVIHFATKYAGSVTLSEHHPLILRSFEAAVVPYVLIRDNLYARLSRNVYYELANSCEEHEGKLGFWSGQRFWRME